MVRGEKERGKDTERESYRRENGQGATVRGGGEPARGGEEREGRRGEWSVFRGRGRERWGTPSDRRSPN